MTTRPPILLHLTLAALLAASAQATTYRVDKLVADGRMLRVEGEPYVTYRLP